MPAPTMGSTLGNLVQNRQRLSAIRQRLGLESAPGTGMRELAPSPVSGPAPVRGHALRAAQDEPDFDFDNFVLPPEKEASMLDSIQGWIDENNNGIDDRKEGAGGAEGVVADARVQAALSPLADFFKQNGRLPSPVELQRVGAIRAAKETLGREPTEDELKMYMTPPAKGTATQPARA